jgi:hypothetical protein
MNNTKHTNMYCLVVLVAACVIAVLSPITLIDMVVGGFAGATIAQLKFALKIGGQIGFGFLGGFLAFCISILTMTVFSGSIPNLIGDYWDLLWCAALHLLTLPGVLIGLMVNRFFWKPSPSTA